MSKRKKENLCIVLSSLGGGGTEQFFINLINKRESYFGNFSFTLILLTSSGTLFNKLDKHGLKIIVLNYSKVRYSIFSLYTQLVRYRFTTLFVGHDEVLKLVALLRPFMFWRPKLVGRCSNVLSEIYHHYPSFDLRFNFFRYGFLNMYDKIVAQSLDIKIDLTNVGGVNSEKIELINNPINLSRVRSLSQQSISRERIDTWLKAKLKLIFIGRLELQKGINFIPEILENVSSIEPNFSLLVLGQGTLMEWFQDAISLKGLSNNLIFKGFVENPYPYLINADVLIMPSYYEGFPNVLLESIALDVPVICFNVQGGINEIVLQKRNGVIIKPYDIEDFSKAIIWCARYLKSHKLYQSIDKFSEQIIYKKYVELLTL